MTINLKVPDMKELKPRITVIGVGGAGGNAVNNMIASGLQGVEFVVANTDAQALATSRAERRIQMGTAVTEGLGAGSKPEIGAAAAEEAMAEIKSQLSGSHMVFITAGMGGGTGTGAAPVIAKAAFEDKILTVGVVTKPFQFEGQRRMTTADAGIKKLSKYVDTLLVIPNQNLFRVATEKTTFADAFALADQVLHSGVACITDLMVKEGLINLDFADVKTVMQGMGKAMMGTGEASGDRRAIEAAEAAISNPLLDDVSMKGASGLLISITGGNDLTLYEVDEAASRIREEVDPEANIILGATFDTALDGQVRVSVVATGLEQAPQTEEETAEDKAQEPEAQTAVASLSQRIAALKAAAPDQPAKAPQKAVAARDGGWQGSADVTIEKRAPQQGQAPGAPVAPKPDRAAAARAQQSFVPQPPSMARKAPRRIPPIEEFPEVAQREVKAMQRKSEETGIRAQKKRIGFFERLTGRRSEKDEAAPRTEPSLTAPRAPQADRGDAVAATQPTASPRPSQPAPASRPSHAAPVVRPQQPAASAPAPQGAPAASGPPKVSKTRLTRDAGTAKQAAKPVSVQSGEEDLEIPAFLRRQAN